MIERAGGRASLIQPLRQAEATLKREALTLAIPADFLAFAQMHADEYRDLAKQAAGKTVRVSFEPRVERLEPAADEQHKQQLRAQVEQEPAVQEVLQIFEARIVDVREEH
jgi:hypothetical protein